MKNKGTYFLVTLLSIMAIVVIIVLVFLLSGNGGTIFNMYKNSSTLLLEKNYKEPIKDINIESITANVTIKEAQDNQIRVEIYGSEKQNASSTLENETLTISLKNKSFCFGFCFIKDEVVLYLPKEIQANLKIKTTSGDMYVESFLVNVDLKSTSGDIKIGEVNKATLSTVSGDISLQKGTDINVTTTSGEIQIQEGNKKIEAKSVSGDIRIDSLLISENSTIKTTSGDVDVKEINDAYIETNTVSGDVEISNNNRFSNTTLKIKTTSGDIHIK